MLPVSTNANSIKADLLPIRTNYSQAVLIFNTEKKRAHHTGAVTGVAPTHRQSRQFAKAQDRQKHTKTAYGILYTVGHNKGASIIYE